MMNTAPVSRHEDHIKVNCPSCEADLPIAHPLDRLFEDIRMDCSTCGEAIRVAVHLKHGMMSAQLLHAKQR